MSTLPKDHSATCRCAQCRQEKRPPSSAQEFLPMMAAAIPTRRNQPNFAVEPFTGFAPAAKSLPWLGNEVADEQKAEAGRRWQPPRGSTQSRPRAIPPTPRRRPSRRWPRRTRWPRRGFATEPTLFAAQGSEQVRWVQTALNQIMGLNLPVNGVMGVATRSALRSFQRERGLPVSGIVGPDTLAALRSVFGSQSAGADDGGEYEEEVEIGPITRKLTWVKPASDNPYKDYPFKREGAANVTGGGVYIVVDADTNKPLKVGKTMSFASRFGQGSGYREDLTLQYPQNSGSVKPGKLRFYLGRIQGVDPFTHIERALARLLLRSDESLPASRYVPEQPVIGPVKLTNILPEPFRSNLGTAYMAPKGSDKRDRPIQERKAPDPNAPQNTLILGSGSLTKWEVS